MSMLVLLHKLDLASEKGRQEGRREEKIEVIKKLLNANVPLDVISQITGLDTIEGSL